MRAEERQRRIAHRHRLRDSLVNEALAGRKPVGPGDGDRGDRLRAGDGQPLGRPLHVEMAFPRLEDRLEHGQGIEPLDLE